jgi:hypothetical protein
MSQDRTDKESGGLNGFRDLDGAELELTVGGRSKGADGLPPVILTGTGPTFPIHPTPPICA